mgnify:CR=1 FL=1
MRAVCRVGLLTVVSFFMFACGGGGGGRSSAPATVLYGQLVDSPVGGVMYRRSSDDQESLTDSSGFHNAGSNISNLIPLNPRLNDSQECCQ